MIQHFHQVIYCSERERRAYFREITVGPKNAIVSNIEKLPPNYDRPYEQMRDQNEAILEYEGKLGFFKGYSGCPFCGNSSVFYCSCSTISCIKKTAKTHYCPGCKELAGVQGASKISMSKSGFLHGGNRITESSKADRQKETHDIISRAMGLLPASPKQIDGQTPSKLSGRMKMKKYLEEKKKRQIEDKSKDD